MQYIETQIFETCLELKKIRQDNNLSLEDVQGLSDIPLANLSRYERGAKVPKVTTLVRWANVLGHKITLLLDKA